MLIVLGMDEAQHVRMRDAHHAHVCTATYAALLHDISYLVNDVHERYWTRRHTGRRADHRAMRPEKFIGHARAAAGLVNRGSSLGVLHDSRKRVWDVQHKTRRELTVSFAGVDQTRRVRNELASQHHFAHGGKKLVTFLTRFGHGNVADDTPHDIRPFLERTPLRILQRIPLANDFSGIDSKLLRLSTRGNGRGADALVSCCFADSCAHYLCLSERVMPRRTATQSISLDCVLGAAVGSNYIIAAGGNIRL